MNSTFERRLTLGLRSYGEGLDMTTQDVERLARELVTKQQPSRTRGSGRIWQVAVAACAVTGVVLGALALRSDPEPPAQPAGPPVATSELAGLWRVEGSWEQSWGWLWHFRTDGTLHHTDSSDGLFKRSATPWKVARVDGGFTQASAVRDPDEVCDLRWNATITPEGRMIAKVATATPKCNLKAGEGVTFTRVSPVSIAGVATSQVWPSTDPEPAKAANLLLGTWLLQGTGKVLGVTAHGGYVLDDLGSPGPQTGTVGFGKDGTVVFTPSGAEGCTAVYEQVTTRNSALTALLSTRSCQALGGSLDTWVRLN